MRKYFRHFLMSLFLFAGLSTLAGELMPVTGIIRTTPGNLVVIGAPTAETEIFVDTALVTAKDYNVRNLISLYFDNNTDTFLTTATTVKVRLNIDRWDFYDNAMSPVVVDLTVDGNNRYLRQTVSRDLLKLTDGYRMKAVIDKIWINGTLNDTLPRFVYVETEIGLTRYFDFADTAEDPITDLDHDSLDTDCDTDEIMDELVVSWGTVVGAEEYQLEWVFVNNYGVAPNTYLPTSQLGASFKYNSTRITTTNTEYRISLAYEKGYVVFRVRAVGRDYLDPEKYIYGVWSANDVVILSTLPSDERYYNWRAHEKEKNWQYSSTFAEEGKKKEVISYFDGSLHNRQSVTKVNTEQNVIVGETIYDYQGRPAVNALPAPVNFPSCSTSTDAPALKYYTRFNRNMGDTSYTKLDFDLDNDDECEPAAGQMDTTSGASQYYSPFNPDKSFQQAFVPDAEMYPFSQIEYTPDNTGRIRSQSGVGPEFRLGTDHETKYLYGQPNQIQLDRMFGSEAGDATHYKKNVVIDANGQTSVSYLNQEGKTIATSLAGIAPTDSNGVYMEALPSAASAAVPMSIDLFNKDANGESILNKITPLQDGIEFSTQLLVTYASEYEFYYDLEIDTLADPCLREDICLSCVYDLTLKIVDECGNDLTSSGTEDSTAVSRMVGHFTPTDTIPAYTFSMACTSPTTAADTAVVALTLQPGVYTVSKTLTINQDAQNFYVTNYLDSTYNSCILTLNDFIEEGLAGIDTTSCYPTCETCAAALGTRDDFVASGQGTEMQYDFLLEQCLLPCKDRTLCDNSFDMMLVDVSPGGQYGGFDPSTYTSSEQLSVFNVNNYINSNAYSGGNSHWKKPQLKLNGYTYNIYLEDDGTRKKVAVEDDPASSNYLPQVDDITKVYTDATTGDLYTYPENLYSLGDFMPAWNPYFARSLVVYHPEYVYYMACSAHAYKYSGDTLSSDNFDSLLVASETFEDAFDNGFILADYDSTGIDPNDKIADLLHSGAHRYDPFFANDSYHLGFLMPNATTIYFDDDDMQNAMDDKMSVFTTAGGVQYTLVEIAAILARCGNNFSSVPDASCLQFGTDMFSPVVANYVQKNDSIRNMEWRFLKNFYLSEKRKIQYKRMEFYAKYYNWTNSQSYGGCNTCIGNSTFNLGTSGINQPLFSSIFPASPFFVNRQPCSWYTWTRYSGVQRRFISPSNTGLNPGSVSYQIYQETGQCPLAYQLQHFLSNMAQTEQLTDTLYMSSVSAFSPDMYNSMNGGSVPSTFINYQWRWQTSAANVLKAYIIHPISGIVDSVLLDKSGTSIPSFDSILSIQNLTFDVKVGTRYFFNASTYYTSGGVISTANITGSSEFRIKDCTFEDECSPNQFASDIQNLMSIINLEGHLKSTTYNITADTIIAPMITTTIKNMLGSPNTNLRWNYTSPNMFDLYDFANSSTRLRFTIMSASPSISYLDSISYFTEMKSNYNHLFKMNGADDLGNIVLNLNGKAEKLSPSDTVGISMGECGLPDPIDCSTTEHLIRKDLETLLNEFLVIQPFDGNVNLFENVNFSLLLQSYLPGTLISTTSTYDSSSVYATSHDTLVFDMDDFCSLELYRHISDPGAHNVNFPELIAVTDLTGVEPMDEQGNFHDFYFIGMFDSAGTIYSDTVRGTSCWPIKNCNHCDTSTTAPLGVTTVIPFTYEGWANYTSLSPFSEVDTLECYSAWDQLDSIITVYNNSDYAMSHNDSLDPDIYLDSLEFLEDGFCNCIDQYLIYLDAYSDLDSASTLPLPDDITYWTGCVDSCSVLYGDYADMVNTWNQYVADNPGLNYPTAFLQTENTFRGGYCHCGNFYIASLTAIMDGMEVDSVYLEALTDLRISCPTAPCVPEAMDTAFVFPPITWSQNPCVAQMISVAILNAQNDYNEYIDSATTSIASRYKEHCLRPLENFNYNYTDKEYHFTLYYYDQAGNLVRTIPPEGVELLAVDSASDYLEQQIILDRTNNTHTVFTNHRMPTTYEYNSLNQLVTQSMPDHDNMDLIEFTLPNGLDSRLRIGRTQLLSGGKGYLSGAIDFGGGVVRSYVYTTNNGGLNWTRVNNVVGATINDISFASSSVGYAVGDDGVILKTTNGGSTWDAKNIYSLHRDEFNAVLFTSTTNGIIGGVASGFSDGIFYTTNGGSTYISSGGLSVGDTVTSFAYDGTYYYASVRNSGEGYIYRTTNPASTWLGVGNVRANDLRKVQYVNTGAGSYIAYAVGDDGRIYKGLSAAVAGWVMIPNGMRQAFRDVYFVNATEGIAIIDSVANKGQIWKTFDGGYNWELLSVPGDYYTSLQAYTSTKVLASGENGLISKVLMTASPYGMIKLDKPSYVNDLKYADAVLNAGVPQAVTIGSNDTLYYTNKTDTSHVVWQKIKTTSFGVAGGDANFKKVLIKDTTSNFIKGVILTTNGKIYSFYKTTSDVFSFDLDSVTDLSSTPITNYFFNDITMDNHQSTKFYAYDTISKRAFTGTIGTSSTPVAVFVYMDTTTAQHNYIQSIAASDNGSHFIMAGERGQIKYKSSPNSTTTTYSNRTYNLSPLPFNSLAVKSSTEIYAAGDDGTVWSSGNGTHWRLMETGIEEKINKLKIEPGASRGAVACNDGKFYKQGMVDSLNLTMTEIDLGTTDDLATVTLNDSIAYVGTSEGDIKHVADIDVNSYTDVNVIGMNGGFKAMAFIPSSVRVMAMGAGSATYQCLGDNSLRNNELFLQGSAAVAALPGISVHFADANNGYLMTSFWDLRHTTDGGNSWKVIIPTTTTPTFAHIHAFKPDKALLMGTAKYAATIIGDNSPATITVSGGGSVPLINVHFNETGYGVITGGQRNVFEVVESGLGFAVTAIGQTPAGSPTNYSLASSYVFRDSTFLVAGQQSRMYYYDGSSFTAQLNYLSLIPSAASKAILDIYFHDDRTGYFVGTGGIAFKCSMPSNIMDGLGATTNGINWDTLKLYDPFNIYNYTSKPTIDIYGIEFSDRTHAFLGGWYNTTPTDAKYAMCINDQSDYFSTRFFYDKLGRMIVSQNSKQYNKSPKAFSYTKYDALGRIKEVGEKAENSSGTLFREIFGSYVNSFYNPKTIDNDSLESWIAGAGDRTEVTKTYYDTVTFSTIPLVQENLRKRVSDVTYEDLDDENDSTYQHATHYTYDIHGNVSTLLQDNPEISIAGQEMKRIDYEYDLISGKVNKVIYQQDSADMFIHRYDYDADNRITHVWTSPDDVIWNQDAKYFYYAHGPLARVEYGHDKVQGLDYAYTLQGWIKGVNSGTLSTNRDMGNDGDGDTANVNSLVNKDAFSYSLGYYDGDYRAIDRLKWNDVTDRFEAQTTGGEFMAQRKELFNGNISHMVTTLSTLDTTGGGLANDQNVLPQVMTYKYDQLNRLKNGVAFDNIDIPNNLWEASGQVVANLYKNTFTYDANGNILSQYRNDETGTRFDSLTYRYKEIGGDKVQNRLYHVNDASAFTSMKADDIDDQGVFVSTAQTINSVNNYMYDEIGNMKADSTEQIDTITWTVYGKIKEISRTSGSSKKRLLFDYDASGNRIAKHVYAGYTWENSTYYSRDAQGNVMGTYKQEVVSASMSYLLKEQHLYGSSRIGMRIPDLEMIGATIDTSSYADTLGKKIFEGTNHLSNVLTTFNDRKIAVDTNSDFITDFRLADVLSSTDYYSFGAPMYARNFDFSGGNYKYGFNGQEKDNEISGEGNMNTAQFWEYDTRLGRRWNIDPRVKADFGSYGVLGNSPISYTDPNGDDWDVKKTEDKEGNVNYSITIDAAILNSSKYQKEIDPKKFEDAVREQIKETYSGEQTNDNLGRSKTTYTIQVNLRTVNSASELKANEHVIEILNSSDERLYDDGYGDAVTPEFGGKKIYITPVIALETQMGINKRTVAHELGHTAGLHHPNDPTAPEEQRLTRRDPNLYNIMWQTGDIKTNRKIWNINSNDAKYLNKVQLGIMHKNFEAKDLNKGTNK